MCQIKGMLLIYLGLKYQDTYNLLSNGSASLPQMYT